MKEEFEQLFKDTSKTIDLSKLEELLKAGADPNRVIETGCTAMHMACIWKKAQRLKVLALLLQYGGQYTSPNEGFIKSHVSVAPLDLAIAESNKDVIDFLASQDSDFKHKLSLRAFPFQQEKKGSLEYFSFLFEIKQGFFSVEEYGFSIAQSLNNRRSDLLEYLLQHGADPNYLEVYTPLTRAKTLQDVKLLLSYQANPLAYDDHGYTRIHEPLGWEDDDLEMVKILIEDYHVPVDFPAKGRPSLTSYSPNYIVDTTALSRRCHTSRNEYEKVVKYLIKKGANVNHKDREYGNTPLHYAANCNAVSKVRLLLTNGAEVNSLNHAGKTPLNYLGQQWDYTELVTLLLKTGANPNSQSKNGRTALHMACEALNNYPSYTTTYNYLGVIGLLKEAGADLLLKDENGKSPLDLLTDTQLKVQVQKL